MHFTLDVGLYLHACTPTPPGENHVTLLVTSRERSARHPESKQPLNFVTYLFAPRESNGP